MEGWVDQGYPAMQRRESNSRPLDHKSDVLTTTLPSHLCSCTSSLTAWLYISAMFRLLVSGEGVLDVIRHRLIKLSTCDLVRDVRHKAQYTPPTQLNSTVESRRRWRWVSGIRTCWSTMSRLRQLVLSSGWTHWWREIHQEQLHDERVQAVQLHIHTQTQQILTSVCRWTTAAT